MTRTTDTKISRIHKSKKHKLGHKTYKSFTQNLQQIIHSDRNIPAHDPIAMAQQTISPELHNYIYTLAFQEVDTNPAAALDLSRPQYTSRKSTPLPRDL